MAGFLDNLLDLFGASDSSDPDISELDESWTKPHEDVEYDDDQCPITHVIDMDEDRR